jgi:hypothetical protein
MRGLLLAVLLLVLAVPCLVIGQAQTVPPRKPGPEVQRLGHFVGTWSLADELSSGKLSGTMVCDWFEGGFALICQDTYTTGRGSDMHIFGYDPQGKTYTWYSVMPTGAGTRVVTLTVDGDRWVADWEDTYQGKPTRYHREWLEESPAALRYRSTRSVVGGAPITVSEWRFTKTK